MSSSRFPEQRRRFDGIPLFAKRPNMKPEGNETESSILERAHDINAKIPASEGNETESSTLLPANAVNATIPAPEGNETESSTLERAHAINATIPDLEENETESPFYDAPENPAESSAIMIAPEDNKTESTPVNSSATMIKAEM